MPKGALNPSDGRRYVWDWNNNIYVKVTQDAQGNPDYKNCDWREEKGVTSNELNRKYNLCINSLEKRSDAEMREVGTADVFLDANGRVLGYMHDCGVVGSIPEWKDIDWIKEEYTEGPPPRIHKK